MKTKRVRVHGEMSERSDNIVKGQKRFQKKIIVIETRRLWKIYGPKTNYTTQ